MTAISLKDKDGKNGKEKLEAPPPDRYDLVYWSLLFIGVSTMLPWDILMTVDSYWHFKLDDDGEINTNSTVLSSEQKSFLSRLGIASSVPTTIVIIAHIFVAEKFGVRHKSLFSLVGMSLTFVGIISLAFLDTSGWVDAFMSLNLFLAVVLNTFRAVLRATSNHFLGKFPVRYIGNFENGIGAGGMAAVLVNLAILSMDVDSQIAGAGCFVFAGSICVISLALFLYMERTEYFRYFSQLKEDADDAKEEKSKNDMTFKLFLLIMKRCWLFFGAMLVLGTATASTFPAVMALVEPVEKNDSEWHQTYYTQVMCYLIYNFTNLVGTAVSGRYQWLGGTSQRKQAIVAALCLIRLGLMPAIMMCNLSPGDRNTEIRVHNDWAYVIFNVVFSFSDGYLRNIITMFAPKTASDASTKSGTHSVAAEEDATAGMLIASTAISYTLGYVLSSPLVKIL